MFHFASPSIILVFHGKFENEFSGGGGGEQIKQHLLWFFFNLLYFKGYDLLAIVF